MAYFSMINNVIPGMESKQERYTPNMDADEDYLKQIIEVAHQITQEKINIQA
jgi:hypothetical protein